METVKIHMMTIMMGELLSARGRTCLVWMIFLAVQRFSFLMMVHICWWCCMHSHYISPCLGIVVGKTCPAPTLHSTDAEVQDSHLDKLIHPPKQSPMRTSEVLGLDRRQQPQQTFAIFNVKQIDPGRNDSHDMGQNNATRGITLKNAYIWTYRSIGFEINVLFSQQ